jgi:membrane associated rhomboid family serine protease
MAASTYEAEKTRAILYPLAAGFVIPGLVGLFKPELITAVKMFILFFVVCVLPGYIIFQILYAWLNGDSLFRKLSSLFLPLPIACPMGTDMKKKSFPWITFSLIVMNIFFFLVLPSKSRFYLGFPPYRCTSAIQYGIAFFMHAFLHADVWHLTGNMIFLWVFGSSLETRTGQIKFLLLYIACIAGSTIFCMIMMAIHGSHFRSIGASGAISGVMGVFAVRCYFSRISVGLPFLFLPWLVVPVRVQALALICLFFAMDMAGSRAMFGEHASRINHWAHSGGYLFGFWLAFALGFHLSASKESVGVKADRLGQKDFGRQEAAKIYQEILKNNPEDVDALTFFLNHYKYGEKQPHIFCKLLDTLVTKDINQAAAVFSDFYPRHLNAISGRTALILGTHFHKSLSLEKARHCLEVAKDKPGPWQAKATFLLGKVFQDMGNKNRARLFFEETCARFPDTPFAREASRG